LTQFWSPVASAFSSSPCSSNARLRAAVRHRLQQQGEEPGFKSGDLIVDLVRRHVTVKGVEVKLSPKEYELLRLLVMHAGEVLTHQHIMREVWGGATDVQYLRIYVRQLRQKIEADPERPQLIQTEAGVGYRLRRDDQPQAPAMAHRLSRALLPRSRPLRPRLRRRLRGRQLPAPA